MMACTRETADQAPVGLAPMSCLAATSADGLLCTGSTADRREMETFIIAAFQQQHGAAVRSFLPVLVGLRDPHGALCGAAGYRPAADGPLYLEQYLAQPVEVMISHHAGRGPVARTAVAEIGNFACRDSATAMTMVAVLARLLRDRGHDWVVFTATRTVRGIMRHMGLPLAEIARAERACLTRTADRWGSYYDQDPRVMLGYVPCWRGSPAHRQEG